jgi:hypothetical protein
MHEAHDVHATLNMLKNGQLHMTGTQSAVSFARAFAFTFISRGKVARCLCKVTLSVLDV